MRIASNALANPGDALSAPSASPAPTAIKPSGNAARPIRCSVVATGSGSDRPTALATSPASVPMTSGLRAISRSVERPPWRASGQTAARLATGTLIAITSAIQARPCAPPRRSESASAM